MDEANRLKRLLLIMGEILVVLGGAATYVYYDTFMKQRSSDPYAGQAFVERTLESAVDVCLNVFGMEPHVVYALTEKLQTKYGLTETKISALQKVCIFLYIIGRGRTNRDGRSVFQHSDDTISRAFHEVLDCIVGRKTHFSCLSETLLRPRDPTFATPSPRLVSNPMYYPYFENCIGALDGNHVDAQVPATEQRIFCNRKHNISFNVLAVCDLDMWFTFVCAGFEGFAHDSRVLNHVLAEYGDMFPHPPPGTVLHGTPVIRLWSCSNQRHMSTRKYYLADKGYPERLGYMIPFHDTRYHISEYRNVAPRSMHEAFNRRHASIRSVIERSFGVVKGKCRILDHMPRYAKETQIDITMTCFALHNFILLHKSARDTEFRYAEQYPNSVPLDPGAVDPGLVPTEEEASLPQRRGMVAMRDAIAG